MAWVDDEPKQGKWVDDSPQEQEWTWKQLGKTMTEALPMAGAAVGGVVGAPFGGPIGAVGGAALGAGAGKSLENIIEAYGFNEPKTMTQTFADPVLAAAEGATGEMGGQIAGKLVQSGLQSLSKPLSNQAERMAARALGAERGTIKKLGADKVQDLGRYALDENLLKPFSNTDDVIAANLAKRAEGGKMMGDVFETIDNANASTFNPLDVASKVDQELGGFYRDPLNKGVTNQLENTLESITMRGDKNIPIQTAQDLKETLGRAANWKSNVVVTEKEKLAREAYSIVNKAIDDAVETGAKSIGTDEILYNLKRGKSLYGASKGAEELLNNKLAREEGNKLIGLTDWGVLGPGAAATVMTGGSAALPTAGILGAKKYAEKFGAQQGALGLDAAAKYLAKSPQMMQLQKTNPSMFQQFVSRLTNLGTQQLNPQEKASSIDKNQIMQKTQDSQYAQVLQKAADKGENSFNAAHYVLMQNDAKYRQMQEGEEQ